MTKPVKVFVDDALFKQLKERANRLEEERDYYKLGVATILSSLIELVAEEQPELFERAVREQRAEYEVTPKKSDARPQRAKAAQQSG